MSYDFFNSNKTSIVKIIGYYNEIIKYVTVVYEGFEKNIRRVSKIIENIMLAFYIKDKKIK